MPSATSTVAVTQARNAGDTKVPGMRFSSTGAEAIWLAKQRVLALFQRKKKGERRHRGTYVTSPAMDKHYIAISIYLVLGLLGYTSVGGVGAHVAGEKKPPIWRRALVILLWPLAMIGAIEG